MTSPFVSVLIDTYNHGRFIEEAVDSVLSQGFPEDQREVLVVDDGSTDDTAERVKKYSSKVRYLYKPNGGQASAFNFGFAHSRGEIIALLDGDDYWLPGKLKRVAEEFQKNTELGMMYHPFLEVDMRTNEHRRSKMPLISGSLLKSRRDFFWYQAPGTCASFRREYLERLLPMPELGIKTQADGYLGLLIPFLAPVLAVPDCLAAYRLHGKNLYHADSELSAEAKRVKEETARTVIKSADHWLRRNGYPREWRLRSFFGRFVLYSDRARFAIRAPTRLGFFCFLIGENYTYSVVQTWKLTTLQYFTALAAFAFGYAREQEMHRWRCGVVQGLQRLVRKLFGRTKASADSREMRA